MPVPTPDDLWYDHYKMIISEADATWAADEFINYFGNFTSIEDYLRFVKRELVPKTNPLMSHEDEFFNEDISPEEMEFEIRFIGDRFPNSLPQDHYKNLLAAVSSHNNESNIPGRELRWMVYEKRTQKIVKEQSQIPSLCDDLTKKDLQVDPTISFLVLS